MFCIIQFFPVLLKRSFKSFKLASICVGDFSGFAGLFGSLLAVVVLVEMANGPIFTSPIGAATFFCEMADEEAVCFEPMFDLVELVED